jgi:hypothetical protein
MRGDALSGLGYAFRLATKTTEQDWEAVQLPRVLTPIYAMVHPFRRFRAHKGDSTNESQQALKKMLRGNKVLS